MEEEIENGAGPSSSKENQSQCSCSDQNLPELESPPSETSKVQNLEQLASVAFAKRGRRAPMKKTKAKRTQREQPKGSGTAQNAVDAAAKSSSRRPRSGRVSKRKTRSRNKGRRGPKRRPRVVRYLSTDTVMSSGSGLTSGSDGPCTTCGHHCCHLSYRECMGVESSRSLLASPLLIKSYAPVDNTRALTHCEVSPEMIHAALRTLTMWREEVTAGMVLNYIMTNYPVCPDKEVLRQDLEEKLRIALITGMVSRSQNDRWRLAQALSRRPSTTHVTLFWEVYYGLSMAPVRRKVPNKLKEEKKQKKKKQ